MTLYAAGWNLPGYLPDTTDGPAAFDTFSDAVDHLNEQADRFWVEDHESAELVHLTGAELAAVDQRWEPLVEALKRAGDGPDFSANTGDHKYEFWIRPLDASSLS
jgi:hypothetical protein